MAVISMDSAGNGNGHPTSHPQKGTVDIVKELESQKAESRALVDTTPATIKRANDVVRELVEALDN
jgi:hypothetical protein